MSEPVLTILFLLSHFLEILLSSLFVSFLWLAYKSLNQVLWKIQRGRRRQCWMGQCWSRMAYVCLGELPHYQSTHWAHEFLSATFDLLTQNPRLWNLLSQMHGVIAVHTAGLESNWSGSLVPKCIPESNFFGGILTAVSWKGMDSIVLYKYKYFWKQQIYLVLLVWHLVALMLLMTARGRLFALVAACANNKGC